MCKYCKNIKTGDDFRPILSKILDCGFLGKIDVDIFLSRSINQTPSMTLGLCQLEGNGTTEVSTRIYYCPICGEDLVKNEDEK